MHRRRLSSCCLNETWEKVCARQSCCWRVWFCWRDVLWRGRWDVTDVDLCGAGIGRARSALVWRRKNSFVYKWISTDRNTPSINLCRAAIIFHRRHTVCKGKFTRHTFWWNTRLLTILYIFLCYVSSSILSSMYIHSTTCPVLHMYILQKRSHRTNSTYIYHAHAHKIANLGTIFWVDSLMYRSARGYDRLICPMLTKIPWIRRTVVMEPPRVPIAV